MDVTNIETEKKETVSNTVRYLKKGMELKKIEDCQNFSISEIHEMYKRHVNSSRVDLLKIFDFANDIADWAEGCWIHTKNGKKILDFTGGIGVLNHGHNHPRILKVRNEFNRAKRMEVHKNYFSQYVAALGHNIAALLPGDLEYSFFPNSGSEAVDGAIKTAFKFHDLKRDVIAHSDISFHGKLFGPATVTHSPENHFPYPKAFKTMQFKFDSLESVKEMVEQSRDSKGVSQIAGLMVEPFNVSNMRASSEAFLRGVREICDKEKIILIYDEVYSGWCKAGQLFYFMNYDGLLPDVLCMAKSFGGGKASISGIVTRKSVFSKAFDNPTSANLQSSTFYGFGEETVTALEAINIIVEDDYVGRSQRIHKKIVEGMTRLKEKYPSIIDRFAGAGAINGIFFKSGPSFLNSLVNLVPGDLYKDPRFMNKLVTAAVVQELYSTQNILTFTSLGEDVHLIVAPSLVVTDQEIDLFFDALDKTLSQGLISIVLKFAKKKFIK